MPRIQSTAAWPLSWSIEETKTLPSSSTSMVAPVCSWIFLITLPPGPMSSPILETGIWMVTIFGAYCDITERAVGSASSIRPRMCSRAARASDSALVMISRLMPAILVSSWKAVMPLRVPVTLKSMSPR